MRGQKARKVGRPWSVPNRGVIWRPGNDLRPLRFVIRRDKHSARAKRRIADGADGGVDCRDRGPGWATSPARLQLILHQLVDDLGPELPTGGKFTDAQPQIPDTTPPAFPDLRSASASKAARAAAQSSGAWLVLRERVKAEQARRGLDRAGLAAALGLSDSTVKKALNHRTPPSVPIAAKLRAFVAAPPDTAPGRPVQAAQAPAGPEDGNGPETPPAPAQAQGNGHAATRSREATASPDEDEAEPVVEEVQELARRLRRKRRPLALTSGTLAGQIGVKPDELDDALHGRAVPPQATARLEGWLAAG